MRVVNDTAAMQRLSVRTKRAGRRIGVVPTMGFLHEGHMSLVRRARELIGPKGLVIITIYVNPTQFAPHEDLAKYPRDLPRDLRLCRSAGVDVVFAPDDRQMYFRGDPAGYSTYVVEEKLSGGMEGVSRPTHFRGVTTVVAKLFNLTLPDVAVFGAKDFQQAAVLQRMVRDLNFPLRMVVAPTFRESDGLAMSSRNKYLSVEERVQATILSETLREAARLVRAAGRPLPALGLKKRLARFIARCPLARLDYLEFFDPATLEPAKKVRRGTQLAMAVFFGKTRLIDNGKV
jgi:pantoate--beta-alanine ligase